MKTEFEKFPLCHPGVAGINFVSTTRGAGNWKHHRVEELSHLFSIEGRDLESDQKVPLKISQIIVHQGQKILMLGFKPHWLQGTPHGDGMAVLYLSEWQDVWAAAGSNGVPDWVKARDLLPGQHVLKLAIEHEKGPWAELVWADVPKRESFRALPVHELTLRGGEAFVVADVICRAISVPVPPVAKKREVFPLKDVPLVNYVPQPKTLTTAHAEVWYRKSVALLPSCVPAHAPPLERVKGMLALRARLLDVAAKAMVDPKLKPEFIKRHPLPSLEDLPCGTEAQFRIALDRLVDPGPLCYSEFTGGMESHYIWAQDLNYWSFDGTRWVQSDKPPLPPTAA